MAKKNNADTAGLEELLTQLNEEAAAEQKAAPVIDDGIVTIPAGGMKIAILRPTRLLENAVRGFAHSIPCWLVYALSPDGKVSTYHAFSFHGPALEPYLNLSGKLPPWMPKAIPGESTASRDGELSGFQWCLATSGSLTVYTKQRDVALPLQPSAAARRRARAKVGAAAPQVVYSPPALRTEGLADALLLVHRVAAMSFLIRSGHTTRAIELVVMLGAALSNVEAGGAESESPQCAVYSLPAPETLCFHTPGLAAALRVILETVRSRRNLHAAQMAAHHVAELIRVMQAIDEARREEAERRIAVEHQEAERRRVQELLGVGDEA